jgi:outer membrane receptor protein involved in Fe transport
VTGFSLVGSAAYTDAKLRQNVCEIDDPTFTCTGAGNSISAPAGTRLPITPKFKASLVGRYEFPVMGDAKAHVQAVLTHQSSSSADLRVAAAALLGRLKPYTMADFAFGIDWSRFTAEAFLENAFDTRAQITRFDQCGQCFNRIYVVPYRPQTIGVRVGTKF